jgi:hypothetical protein
VGAREIDTAWRCATTRTVAAPRRTFTPCKRPSPTCVVQDSALSGPHLWTSDSATLQRLARTPRMVLDYLRLSASALPRIHSQAA